MRDKLTDKLTIKLLIKRVKESALIVPMLPHTKAAEYFSAWPGVIDKARESKLVRRAATPEEISRFEEVWQWTNCVDAFEFQLIWCRGAKILWKHIAGEHTCDCTTVRRKWRAALAKVVRHVNGQESNE